MHNAHHWYEAGPMRAPGVVRLALEWRAPWEFGAALWSRPLLRLAPRGDGQPVIVYPGLLAGDGSAALLRPVPRPGDVEAVVEQLVSLFGVIGSPGFPADPAALRSHIERGVRRAYDPAGTLRQLLAIIAAPDRRARLKRISAPTLVIHGVDDPLVPLEAGRDTARSIPGARLMAIEGMGHDLPPALWPVLVEAIAAHCRAAG